MHHHPPNHKRTLNLLFRVASKPIKVSVLSQIEPQTPHLVVSFRQFIQILALRP